MRWAWLIAVVVLAGCSSSGGGGSTSYSQDSSSGDSKPAVPFVSQRIILQPSGADNVVLTCFRTGEGLYNSMNDGGITVVKEDPNCKNTTTIP